MDDELRKIPSGLSIDQLTIDRIDALAGGKGKRSKFMREMLFIGLASRYGERWADVADALREHDSEPLNALGPAA